jgi:WD40 repeat protein
MKTKLALLFALLLLPLTLLHAQFDPPYTTVALELSPDGTTLLLSGGVGDCTGRGGYELRLFNIGQNVINRWMRGFTCGHVGTYSPNGLQIASAGNGEVIVWDAITRNPLASTEIRNAVAVSWRADGTQLAVAADNVVILNVGTLQPAITLDAPGVRALAFSPTDANTLVTLDEANALKQWSVLTSAGETLAEGVTDMAWSGDGALIAAIIGDNVTVFDATTGASVEQFAGIGEDTPLREVAMSDDGRVVVAVQGDNIMTTWDLRTDAELFTYLDQGMTVNALSVATIASGSYRVFYSGDPLSDDYTEVRWFSVRG